MLQLGGGALALGLPLRKGGILRDFPSLVFPTERKGVPGSQWSTDGRGDLYKGKADIKGSVPTTGGEHIAYSSSVESWDIKDHCGGAAWFMVAMRSRRIRCATRSWPLDGFGWGLGSWGPFYQLALPGSFLWRGSVFSCFSSQLAVR